MNPIDPQLLCADWSYPTRVRFGPGRIVELPDACRALGMAQPLLVTDPMLAQHAIGQRVRFDDETYTIFASAAVAARNTLENMRLFSSRIPAGNEWK